MTQRSARGGGTVLPMRIPTLLLTALAAAAPTTQAQAQGATGKIVFARGGALYQQADDGKGEATELAGLSDDATEARFLEATVDAKLIAIDMGQAATWLQKGAGALGSGPCVARARPSPRGECVVCPGVDTPQLVSAKGDTWKGLEVAGRDLQFRGPDGKLMVMLTDNGVIGFDRRTPKKTEVLAKAGAKSHLVVSPDGTRAAAVFGEGATSRIKTFLLDGEGTPRQLGGPGVPILWSWDSSWLITQEGINPDEEGGGDDDDSADAGGAADRSLLAAPKKAKPKKKPEPKPEPKGPTTRACAVRATGGETKCWDDYEGLAFSPDSTRVLLRKGTSLYVGKIAGVRPEPPVKLLDNIDGAATWIP
jgi:hypothetical protein